MYIKCFTALGHNSQSGSSNRLQASPVHLSIAGHGFHILSVISHPKAQVVSDCRGCGGGGLQGPWSNLCQLEPPAYLCRRQGNTVKQSLEKRIFSDIHQPLWQLAKHIVNMQLLSHLSSCVREGKKKKKKKKSCPLYYGSLCWRNLTGC